MKDAPSTEGVTDAKRIKMLTGGIDDALVTLRLAQGGLLATGANEQLLRQVRNEISNLENRREIYGEKIAD